MNEPLTRKNLAKSVAGIEVDIPAVEPETFSLDDCLMQVVTAQEVAEQFEVKQGSVLQAIRRHSLAARRSGGTWLIRRSDAAARWASRGTGRGISLIAASAGFAGLIVTIASIAQ